MKALRAVAAMLLVTVMCACSRQAQFVALEWQRGSETALPSLAKTPRSEMIDDLTTSHLRSGMGRKEIIDLLGKPDTSAGSSGDELHYHYTRDGLLFYEHAYLLMSLDQSGNLVSWRLHEVP
jgi:outer membrane protein assembly factor BamE (lipoprotein component of BamABCDE complex)